jgi:mannose-6-phosphate isomerase-like protein (cupin superfamily)
MIAPGRLRAVTAIPPGRGEVIGDAPERRVEILCDRPLLNATLSRYGPGREGADLHVHRAHSDLFYVLEGVLTVRLGAQDRQVSVPAGSLARVPPGVVHGFRNAGAGEVRYLNFHAPGRRFADYLRALRDGRTFTYDQFPPPPDGGMDPASADVTADSEVLADVEDIRVAVRAAEPEPRHAHAGRLEALYVLSGELAVSVGDHDLRAPAGTWVRIDPGVAHAVECPEPTRVVSLHAPGRGHPPRITV